MKEVEEAIQLAPTSSLGYTNKAALLLAQGRKQDALANFQKAVEIDPKSLGAYLALASYHWTTGAMPEAEKAMKDALAIEPANATANRALALLLMSTGRAARSRAVRQGDGEGSRHTGSRTVAGGLLPRRSTAPPTRPRSSSAWRGAESTAAAGRHPPRPARIRGRATRRPPTSRLDAVLAKHANDVDGLVTRTRWLMAEDRPAGRAQVGPGRGRGGPHVRHRAIPARDRPRGPRADRRSQGRVRRGAQAEPARRARPRRPSPG